MSLWPTIHQACVPGWFSNKIYCPENADVFSHYSWLAGLMKTSIYVRFFHEQLWFSSLQWMMSIVLPYRIQQFGYFSPWFIYTYTYIYRYRIIYIYMIIYICDYIYIWIYIYIHIPFQTIILWMYIYIYIYAIICPSAPNTWDGVWSWTVFVALGSSSHLETGRACASKSLRCLSLIYTVYIYIHSIYIYIYTVYIYTQYIYIYSIYTVYI